MINKKIKINKKVNMNQMIVMNLMKIYRLFLFKFSLKYINNKKKKNKLKFLDKKIKSHMKLFSNAL